ncbi:hypothetical protein L249_4639 [Ophiocordyceps polyrhachis-furcata BCC 54312]|uniref:Uncharacterized protein n=1 Tax=Ophiocordyceps polyrhachis-furcata BCC 54312 TaxID=1330021 RepID=A0A367L332_9HYPO|nr:hypothetical protein L249_4639 [Ophiocordyceps polyrhachis-furcata BCC 54312]
MREQFSNLEVLPDTTLPEACRGEQPQEKKARPRRICRLSPRAFLLALCGVVLVAGGAIAGGVVGGTRAAKSNSRDSEPSSTPTSTMAEKKPTQTLIEVGPTQTLYRDCPSANDTIYRALGSADYQFRKICNAAYYWSTNRKDVVNQRAGSLDDCIDLCAAFNVRNRTEIAAGTSDLCNGVCWRHSISDSDWPGQCFGSTMRNSSDAGFPYSRDVRCDSAGWINQRLPVA